MDPHYFIAFTLPDSIKEAITPMIMHGQQEKQLKSWVHPEDLHLTLVFIGSSTRSTLEGCLNQIEAQVKGNDPIEVKMNRVDTFGDSARPRVIWIGIEESIEVETIRENIYKVCTTYYDHLDKRPFTPHITLGRKWIGKGVYQHELFHDRLQQVSPTKFVLDEIALYETKLEQKPKYNKVRSIKLHPFV
ncbi:hypothetical protein Q73_11290 [Bacillus coahuilensis m2-6]|uniref:RNA 2',3'-cyclic phosphodiesterase n=1 Tax=Bacillus coahuilensis TaxID=408580 RepID=UPI0007505FE9|nr:RNA 2',3'-cyclic phosphodiesterase [Bacillus coahuilensis]KUP06724.1 hypothetical protein Q73_11290 [Bacillus coahuilensis m2-6]